MEAQEIWLYLLGRNSDYAERWQKGLEEAVVSLETFPRRCSLAPENYSFPYELRQLLYGSYRLLFTLIDANDDGKIRTVDLLQESSNNLFLVQVSFRRAVLRTR